MFLIHPVCLPRIRLGHFFKENTFMERDSRGIQKSTSELLTPRGTRVMAASSFSFQWKIQGRTDQKKRFPAIFGTFPILMYFWRGNPGASKNPRGTSFELWSFGTRDMAARSFNFHWKTWGEPSKNCDFLKFRFSDPLKAQNRPQRGPLLGHLIGPFLSSGFTSGLGPLPTCYNTACDFHSNWGFGGLKNIQKIPKN